MRIAITHRNTDTIRFFSHLITELGFEICWTCQTANESILHCKTDLPDLLLAQIELEDMPCHELIKIIMATTPTTVIVIGSAIKQKPADIFEAMSAGALDAFCEPTSDQPKSIQILKNKILNINKLHVSINSKKRSQQTASIKNIPLVAIGASTGGPAALLTILKRIPVKTNAIWVIIQHMDIQFSQGMAQWLNEQTKITVEIAKDKQTPRADHVYMAATNDHLIINESGRFQYITEPSDYPYRPSVNVFFESAVNHWPNKLIGVLLTGMGRDGANGLLSFYNRGMLTIAQDKKSCAVYGMPKAACDINAVTIELGINEIADKILKNIF